MVTRGELWGTACHTCVLIHHTKLLQQQMKERSSFVFE
jgi:hypothetical protein